jgi:hypothetical protein
MPQGEHVHTGVVSFLFAGISAVIFIQLVRLVSAKMIDAGHDRAGSTLGALVNFG